MDRVKRAINELSGRRNKSCYQVLCCAVEVMISYAPNEPQMKVIFSGIAGLLKKDNPKSVAKALSWAADDIRKYRNRAKLCELYGYEPTEHPTPKDLIYRLADRLRDTLEYHPITHPRSGEYGIRGYSHMTNSYVIAYPCAKNFARLQQLAHALTKAQTPLRSFSEYFLRSNVIAPQGYSENNLLYNAPADPFATAMEELFAPEKPGRACVRQINSLLCPIGQRRLFFSRLSQCTVDSDCYNAERDVLSA